MTSISNLLIHEDTPGLLVPPPKLLTFLISPISSPSQSTCLPPIQGNDPSRKLNYHDTLYIPPLLSPPQIHSLPSPSPSYQSVTSPTYKSQSLSLYQKRRSSSPESSATQEPHRKKRGRPSSTAKLQDDQLTFLTPTVWNIPTSKDQKERASNAKQCSIDQMNESMTAFTTLDMNTVLYMPRKKRGRKPKTFIHGNSCFIWKDLTASRSTNK